MSYIKTQEEIQYILDGGKILGEILEHLTTLTVPGATAFDIDAVAERLIRDAGGRPAFKGYRQSKRDPKFPSTICASVNEEIVHGVATKDKILKEGDIFSMDIGMQWPMNCGKGEKGNGFFTDTAITVPVGKIDTKTEKLLSVTKKSLEIGIEQMQIGNTVEDIGKEIERYVAPQGYGIVRQLSGHGVGHGVHEDPYVPNYHDRSLSEWKIEPGVVLAIEPMITLGTHEIEVLDDDWTIVSKDRSLSGHFEHTIVVTENGPVVATRRPGEKK
ncbi:MAG: type I methionyl aminopeptidase [Candidatus Magasanikbacteria bacterium]|jgi:methionyl aminopeptidase|nr:type I methionyl aminopeptidase [Candidatus Magasanikbacteria bacterium]MBT5262688.1 type I methionyl aminopeptidase [Candidatus Magasanikbacteria bacterium]MBT5820302.1 type I methionyl aminopeptidase [Candidatus Magasanikbacteria bacterium]MBT6294804.1 type I methionyl aminopeptidase [Candidatus Magasanikbacteria bacterium]